MALQFVTDQIKDDAITSAKIADGTITSSQMAMNGGFAFTGALTSSATPSNANDVANKSYVDNIAAGLHWKDSVKAASTANLDLNGTETIDGVSVGNGDRVLVKNQNTASENGIYVCAAGGAWSRADDMDAASEFAGAAMFVREGTTQADTGWVCTNDADPNVGTTAIVFAQFSGGGSLTGGDGITITGNSVSVDLPGVGSALSFSGGELVVSSGGVANAMLANDSVTITAGAGLSGGGEVDLGATISLAVSGVANAQISNSAAIADTKLATISTADKVSGSAVQLAAAKGLENDSGLALKIEANKGLEVGANGLAIDLEANKGLEMGANGLAIDLESNKGLTTGANGLAIALDGSTLALGASGISVNEIANAQISASAAIADSKLATISTADKVSGSAVQLASSNATLTNDGGLLVRMASTGGLQAIGSGLSLKLNGSSLSMDANGLKIGVVEQADLGYQPRKDGYTGNGSATAFNLTTRILSNDWLDGALVTRNGQVLNQVASSPTGVEEYTVTDDGSNSTITFGSAPANGDVIRVLYFA